LKRGVWNAKSGPKYGRRGVVLVIAMPGRKVSGIPFVLLRKNVWKGVPAYPSLKYPWK
jgi:hypothetical protein